MDVQSWQHDLKGDLALIDALLASMEQPMSEGCPIRRSFWSGSSSNANVPDPIRFTVVSWPATASVTTIAISSFSLSLSLCSLASISAETKSLLGMVLSRYRTVVAQMYRKFMFTLLPSRPSTRSMLRCEIGAMFFGK